MPTTPDASSGAAAAQKLPSRDKAKKATSSTDGEASSSSFWPVRPVERTASQSSFQAVEDALRHHTREELASKCSAGPDAVCCKDLKDDDERTLVDPDIVRDIIIGLSDGLTVPFALTAGLSGLGDSRIVVLGGLAELIAGAISMGIGGFLAAQSELDHFHYLRRQTHARVLRSCTGEMEREVHAILGSVGLEEPISRLVAENLLRVESEQATAADWDDDVLTRGSSGSGSWWKLGLGKKASEEEGTGGESLKWSKDVGVTGFLLKFGEGLEETPVSRLYISAFTIGLSYFIGGLCPLTPYFFVANVETGLFWSIGVTLLILLLFGLAKTHFTGATGGVRGYAWGAVSTMLVGGVAAGAAFGIVRLLEV